MKFKVFGVLLLLMTILTAVFWGVGIPIKINWMYYAGIVTLCLMAVSGILVHVSYFKYYEEFDTYALTIITRIIAWIIAPIPGIIILGLSRV
jgi:heme/copper-type cytochrome/quinol oxidase subunit 4